MRLERDKLMRSREMLGYGLEKTAEVAGVSKNSVLRAEHGEDIRPGTARKIARALEVEVRDLLPLGQVSLPDFEDGQRATVYRFTGKQRVTAEKLREHGVEANDSEVHVLNQYIELHERPPAGAVAIWNVAKEDEPVDYERVKTLLAFVLWKGMLSPEQADAAGKALHAELAGTSA